MSRSRLSALLAGAIAVGAVLLALRTSVPLWRFADAARELPLWDEAKYGLDGARLAEALSRFDLPRFMALVYALDVWPPFFPLVESVAFLVAGNGFAVARCLVVATFAALVIATWWAAHGIARESPAIGAIAAALVVASPFVQVFSVQAMLEVPGALLFALSLAFYARHLHTGTRATLVATGVASAALFFTKYNYGLLWLVPLFLNEAWLSCGGFRAMVARAIANVRRLDWRRPFTLFVALYLAVLAAILVTGGATLPFGEKGVSVTSIGNPLLGLIVIVIARAARRPRRSWVKFRAWERSLGRRPRVLFWTVIAPATAWLLLPPHLRSFVDFVENRSDGPSLLTAGGWLFYPKIFAEQFHANAVVGWVVVAAAVTAPLRIGRAATSVRIVLLCVMASVAALTLHPYKEPRFILIAAPVWWIAAAWNVVTLIQSALVRARVGRVPSPASWNATVALIVLVAALRAPAATPSLPVAFAGYTVPASTTPVLEQVLELTIAQPTLLLGTWNQASPTLFEWWILQQVAPSASGDGVTVETAIPSRRGSAPDQIARRLREGHAPGQVVFFDVDPATAPSPQWSAAFAEEIAWLAPVRAELGAGKTPYAVVERFAGSGYDVRVYHRDAATRAFRPAE